jgi:predicted amidohydrolase
VLARAGDERDEIVYAEVDRALIEDTRDLWGFFRDRRPDEYGLVAETAAATGRQPAGAR